MTNKGWVLYSCHWPSQFTPPEPSITCIGLIPKQFLVRSRVPTKAKPQQWSHARYTAHAKPWIREDALSDGGGDRSLLFICRCDAHICGDDTFVESLPCSSSALQQHSPKLLLRCLRVGSDGHFDALRRRHCDVAVSGPGLKSCPDTARCIYVAGMEKKLIAHDGCKHVQHLPSIVPACV